MANIQKEIIKREKINVSFSHKREESVSRSSESKRASAPKTSRCAPAPKVSRCASWVNIFAPLMWFVLVFFYFSLRYNFHIPNLSFEPTLLLLLEEIIRNRPLFVSFGCMQGRINGERCESECDLEGSMQDSSRILKLSS